MRELRGFAIAGLLSLVAVAIVLGGGVVLLWVVPRMPGWLVAMAAIFLGGGFIFGPIFEGQR